VKLSNEMNALIARKTGDALETDKPQRALLRIGKVCEALGNGTIGEDRARFLLEGLESWVNEDVRNWVPTKAMELG